MHYSHIEYVCSEFQSNFLNGTLPDIFQNMTSLSILYVGVFVSTGVDYLELHTNWGIGVHMKLCK